MGSPATPPNPPLRMQPQHAAHPPPPARKPSRVGSLGAGRSASAPPSWGALTGVAAAGPGEETTPFCARERTGLPPLKRQGGVGIKPAGIRSTPAEIASFWQAYATAVGGGVVCGEVCGVCGGCMRGAWVVHGWCMGGAREAHGGLHGRCVGGARPPCTVHAPPVHEGRVGGAGAVHAWLLGGTLAA